MAGYRRNPSDLSTISRFLNWSDIARSPRSSLHVVSSRANGSSARFVELSRLKEVGSAGIG